MRYTLNHSLILALFLFFGWSTQSFSSTYGLQKLAYRLSSKICPLESQYRLAQAHPAKFVSSAMPFFTKIDFQRYMVGEGRSLGLIRSFQNAPSLTLDGKLELMKWRKYTVTPMSRKEGLKAIWDGINQYETEHTWAFISKFDLWVDVTMATEGNSVFGDPKVMLALKNQFGRVEVYHSHPRIVLERAHSVPQIRELLENAGISSEIASALPSGGDLSTLVRRTWEARHLEHPSGIIHPNGVTLYSPKLKLYNSKAGPPISDIGTMLYGTWDKEKLQIPAVLKGKDLIRWLVKMQMGFNQIQSFNGNPDLPAFEIGYFDPSELDLISPWLDIHSVSLQPSSEN